MQSFEKQQKTISDQNIDSPERIQWKWKSKSIFAPPNWEQVVRANSLNHEGSAAWMSKETIGA